ncbi:SDR family oxidoreductase [Rhodopirellula europaea]|uniref:SDR family oxidoreductase n=1 Tax=Rhodopirellula europaea TaxID=1263866 RepID=UPI003D2B4808|tara:strand:+ start:2590 stop:3630 length:1041 start_codon:yes stop_codon:yes gene_type:complete
MLETSNRVVVITGASAGIGRAAVRRFAAGGYDVGLIARGEDGLNAAADEVRRQGRRAVSVPCDVADAEAVEAAATQIENELGPIDVWVNNAMASVFSPIAEMTAEEFKRVTEVSYLGYVYGTLSALRRMRSRNRGTIVQVGSALAYRSIPLQSAYCAAKHAIVGFTDSLRSELIHEQSDVHVTTVHMPAVNTPQFSWVKSRLPNKAQPVPPIYQPEVAADAIYFAAHHRRRELWVAYSAVQAIMGQKIAPGFADKYLAENGFASQQTSEPRDADQPDNLWSPVDGLGGGDHGAHGNFDERARWHSPLLSVVKTVPGRQLAILGAGAGIVALIGARLFSAHGKAMNS